MILQQFLGILVVHYIADFILQTRWQAENKSHNIEALAIHVMYYTFGLSVGVIMIFGAHREAAAWFTIINGALHFVTDFITSRITAKLYARKQIWGFFAVVGLDQLIHQVTLGMTFYWLLA